MAVENNRNRRYRTQAEYQRYIESCQQFLSYESEACYLDEFVAGGIRTGFTSLIDNIALEPLKTDCMTAITPLLNEIDQFSENVLKTAVGSALAQRCFLILFQCFQDAYNEFPKRFKPKEKAYKTAHKNANSIFDMIYDHEENISIVNEVINIENYKVVSTLTTLDNETKQFVSNTINWLENGIFYFTSFGKSIVCKKAKDDRLRREAMLHFPYSLGNPMEWNMMDTFDYFSCGSAAQNQEMGTKPALTMNLNHLSSKKFVIKLIDIKRMMDISISGDHAAALAEARLIGWKRNGKGPILKRSTCF